MSRRIVAAVVAFSLILVSGCKRKSRKPPADDSNTAISCEIRTDYPHRSSTNRNFVDGKATIVCKGGTVDQVSVTAVLELSRGGRRFTAQPPVAGWDATKNGTSVKAGTPTTAVAAYACNDVHPGDRFRTTYKTASVTDKGKAAKLSVKGDNPNPPNGMELSCL